MIRVLIKALSAAAKARLEGLLRSHPQFRIIDDTPDQFGSADILADSEADVLLAEADDEQDLAEMLDNSAAGVPSILLVRDPVTETARALRHGVRAVLPSGATGEQIAAAIRAVAAGLVVFDFAAVGQAVTPYPANGVTADLSEALTTREIEVLRAMSEGLANKEIAARLGVSENTIKFHVASIMGKLGAASRTEAVMLGIRHGIVFI